MTYVSRQFGQMGFDVLAGPIPVAQCFNDKAVAQIMNAWAVVIGRLAQSDLVGQADKPTAHDPPGQASALLGKQEAWALGMRADLVPQTPIPLESFSGGRVDGDPAGLIEFGLANPQSLFKK
jgi:hypothetical protein